MSICNMNPNEFADELDLTLEDEIMVKGVEFAKYTDKNDNTRYHLVDDEGYVHPEILKEVYSSGNYTLARTSTGDKEVMVDDDGIHDHW